MFVHLIAEVINRRYKRCDFLIDTHFIRYARALGLQLQRNNEYLLRSFFERLELRYIENHVEGVYGEYWKLFAEINANVKCMLNLELSTKQTYLAAGGFAIT